MKKLHLVYFLFFSLSSFAQKHHALVHGQVFGNKPDVTGMMNATKVEAFMDKKPRVSTTIRGRVVKVTKEKGGWFEIDAGNGKTIAAHFSDYNVNVPTDLKGRYVVAEGIAAKQFTADDHQHFAGNEVKDKKHPAAKTSQKQSLTFEVKGMKVE